MTLQLFFLHIYILWQNRFDRLYRISMRERPKTSRLAYTYGETPIQVVKEICNRITFDQQTRFLELGSGIGVFSLYVSLVYGSHSTGIDILPTFIRASRRCSNILSVSANSSFIFNNA